MQRYINRFITSKMKQKRFTAGSSWSRGYIFYWILLFFRGTFAVKAIWVIGAYFFFDVLGGVVSGLAGIGGGVALRLYEILIECVPDGPDTEMAFLRMAQIQWNEIRDAAAAFSLLTEMKSRFPQGNLCSYAHSLQSEIQNSSGRQGTVPR